MTRPIAAIPPRPPGCPPPPSRSGEKFDRPSSRPRSNRPARCRPRRPTSRRLESDNHRNRQPGNEECAADPVDGLHAPTPIETDRLFRGAHQSQRRPCGRRWKRWCTNGHPFLPLSAASVTAADHWLSQPRGSVASRSSSRRATRREPPRAIGTVTSPACAGRRTSSSPSPPPGSGDQLLARLPDPAERRRRHLQRCSVYGVVITDGSGKREIPPLLAAALVSPTPAHLTPYRAALRAAAATAG
jgi:hypothetical protein